LSQRFGGQWGFVGQQDVRAARPLEYLIRRCSIVTDELSEFRYLVPGVITGIQSVAIKNNDLHSASNAFEFRTRSIKDAVGKYRADVAESA
jgi:hypothetical protein